MIGNYKIVTLCGSAKFKNEFLMIQQNLTIEGNIVLLPTFFDENKEIPADKFPMLKDMHLKRIDMADEIFVINKDNYIGSSTKTEIEYALAKGKKVAFLVPETTYNK